MNSKIIFILFLLLIACTSENRSGPGKLASCDTVFVVRNAEVIPVIKEVIQKKVKNINDSLKYYHLVEAISMEYSTEGSAISGYYAGDRLKKVTASHMGEMGKAAEYFYFNNDTVFYYEHQQTDYAEPIYIKNIPKVVGERKTRCYFSNLRLVFMESADTIKVENEHQVLLNMSSYLNDLKKANVE